MTCLDVTNGLDRIRSGEIDSATRASLDEHLAGCANCKARLTPAAVAMPGSAAVNAVLFPEEIAGVPRGWVYTVVSLGSATLVLSIVVMYLLGRPATAGEPVEERRRATTEERTRPEPATSERAHPEPTVATAPQADPTPDPTAAPAMAPVVLPAPVAASAEASAPRAGAPTPRQIPSSAAPKARSDGTAVAAAAPPAPEAEATIKPAPAAAPEAAEPPPKPKDEIEKLLFDATGSNTAPPPVKEEKAGDEPTGLTRSQVMEVMNSLQDKVHECAVQTGKSGTVQITATVVPTGRVKSVRVAGMFAGTPTGDCVATVIRGAVFPTFVGQPQPVNYPVPLR